MINNLSTKECNFEIVNQCNKNIPYQTLNKFGNLFCWGSNNTVVNKLYRSFKDQTQVYFFSGNQQSNTLLHNKLKRTYLALPRSSP